MFGVVTAKLGLVFKTKLGLALVGALVLGGGGTAVAMATSAGQPLSYLAAFHNSPTMRAGGSSSATKGAGKDDQDDQECTGSGESPHATHTPEATERPDGTHTPGSTPTGGHGGD